MSSIVSSLSIILSLYHSITLILNISITLSLYHSITLLLNISITLSYSWCSSYVSDMCRKNLLVLTTCTSLSLLSTISVQSQSPYNLCPISITLPLVSRFHLTISPCLRAVSIEPRLISQLTNMAPALGLRLREISARLDISARLKLIGGQRTGFPKPS